MNQILHHARSAVLFAYGLMMLHCITSCNILSDNKGSLRVKQDDRTIEVANGKVRLLLSIDTPALKQQYFARSNDNWMLVAESLQQNQVAQNAVLPLYKKGPDVAENYRVLANDGPYQ